MRRALSALSVLVASLYTSSASAQMALDGSMGPAGFLAGPNHAIPASVGRQVGANLFHSFAFFNVNTGESATFSGPAGLANVVGRVTGGMGSNVNGLVRSTISGANLFLINPSGIVFGPNARLDVSGVFYASTAHYLRLGADGRFDAVNPNATVLTSVPPSAFGFVSRPVNAIVVNGAPLQSLTRGTGLALVGGDIGLNGAQLAALAGNVGLASVRGAGEVALTAQGPEIGAGVQRGLIVIANGSFVTSQSSGALGAGRVVIRGGTLTLADSQVLSDNRVAAVAADTVIDASGTLALERASIVSVARAGGRGAAISVTADSVANNNGSRISSFALGAGASGDIIVDARQVGVTRGAGISATSEAAGAAGNVTVRARESLRMAGLGADGSVPLISSTSAGSGRAGDVSITAPLVDLNDHAQIVTSTTGSAATGNILVNAQRVALAERARIVVSSADGDAGRIELAASESVAITRSDAAYSPTLESGLFNATSGRGRGGDIVVRAPVLELSDGAIQAQTQKLATAGNVALEVARLTLARGSRVDQESRSDQPAGTLTIDASESVSLAGRNSAGRTSALAAFAFGTGRGGAIVVRTPELNLSDFGSILVDAFDGSPGTVSVDANRISVASLGQVSSSSIAPGAGGTVTLNARERVSVSGGGVFGTTFGSGRGSDIAVKAPLIELTGGGISTRSAGSGMAGNITLEADRVVVAGGAQVVLNSEQSGAAGRLAIVASESVSLATDGTGTPSGLFSRTLGSGQGGDIRVIGASVSVDNAAVRADTSGSGSAGSIVIDASRFALTGGGQLDSSTASTGSAGRIVVNAAESVTLAGRNTTLFSNIITGTTGRGQGGEISINAPVVSISDGFVSAESRADGAAGNLAIRAGDVVLRNGGEIRSSARAGGDGGRIAIDASTLSLADAAEISTSSTGAGRGGAISVATTDSVTLSGGSSITASSTSTGDAGNIAIDAGAALTLKGSSIRTEARSADGGNIDIKALAVVRLTNSQITTSVGTGFGNGGNITIDPIFVILDGSRIQANAFGGNGGNIDITTQALLQSGGSVIEASSQLGIQGNIEINAPESDLAGGLAPPPGSLLDPSLLLRESCSARAARAGNSFVGVGYGGLPQRPGSLAFSSYAEGAQGSAAGSVPLFALATGVSSTCYR